MRPYTHFSNPCLSLNTLRSAVLMSSSVVPRIAKEEEDLADLSGVTWILQTRSPQAIYGVTQKGAGAGKLLKPPGKPGMFTLLVMS